MFPFNKNITSINSKLFYNFSYYNFNHKNLKNFLIENRYVGKFNRNKNLFPNWNDICSKHLSDIGFYDKFKHPQDVTEGYITTKLYYKVRLVIFRGFTHTSKFDSFNKSNIFIKKNFQDETYLNVRNFGVAKSINVLNKRKNCDYSDIIQSINNDINLQNKLYLDLEEKVDVIIQNKNLMDSISGEEKFFIEQHFENCLNKVDHTCLQCINIENKYGIIKVTSEFIKIKLGL